MAQVRPRASTPHMHWKVRADDYRRLAEQTKDPELRRVLEHLTQVCAEMAKATDPDSPTPPKERWIHPNDVVREQTAERWRIRETEYRAIASSCASRDGKRSWSALADRCASLAYYLDAG